MTKRYWTTTEVIAYIVIVILLAVFLYPSIAMILDDISGTQSMVEQKQEEVKAEYTIWLLNVGDNRLREYKVLGEHFTELQHGGIEIRQNGSKKVWRGSYEIIPMGAD